MVKSVGGKNFCMHKIAFHYYTLFPLFLLMALHK